MPLMNSISSIIICFHPDVKKVNGLIESIDECVDQIIVFDNGGLNTVELNFRSGKVRVESRGVNVGIAEALNIGCGIALESGCRFIVTFDQDSAPEKSMIPVLVEEFLKYPAGSHRVAAIGPQLIDVRDASEGIFPFIQFSSFGYHEWRGEGTQPVSQLITSGCLIDLDIWVDDNKFDDRLFIDFVDNNWCWRVIRKGYVVLGTAKTKMTHELSDQIKKKNLYSLNAYGPMRRYFQARNAVYHLCYEKLSIAQKFYVLKSLGVTFCSVLFADKRSIQSLWQCVRGVGHGIGRRFGPF